MKTSKLHKEIVNLLFWIGHFDGKISIFPTFMNDEEASIVLKNAEDENAELCVDLNDIKSVKAANTALCWWANTSLTNHINEDGENILDSDLSDTKTAKKFTL